MGKLDCLHNRVEPFAALFGLSAMNFPIPNPDHRIKDDRMEKYGCFIVFISK